MAPSAYTSVGNASETDTEPKAAEVFKVFHLKNVDMEEISIDELQRHLQMGTFTSLELTIWTIARINQTNKYLNAVTEINPDATQIAEDLDRERKSGGVRGPLHGIPTLVKDNMATADKMQTTAGSLALVGAEVPRDAHVVKLLRDAGAIIVGHSSMCEWASMKATEDSIGASARGGQVRNPYNLSMSAWGSSNGSAVAVAASIVPFALGSETDTSIIGPAYMTGLVGIKPTVGLTSRSGVIPISKHMDTVGPLARSVRDATHALNAIAGPDSRDPYTSEAHLREEDYTQFLQKKHELEFAAFGIPMKRIWDAIDEDTRPVMLSLLEKIRNAGARVYEVDFPSWEEMISEDGWSWKQRPPEQSEYQVCAVDFYNGLKSYLSDLSNTPIRSVEDVIAFNNANPKLEGASPGDNPAWPLGHNTLVEVAEIRGCEDGTYFAALEYIQRKSRDEGIDAALRYQPDPLKPAIELDALLVPDRRYSGQQLAAQAGYPIVCIPVGVDEQGGRPYGLSLQSTAFKEGKLVKYASAIEDLLRDSGFRRPRPQYREHTAANIPVIP